MTESGAADEDEIDPLKEREYIHLATRFYLLAVPALVLCFVPAAGAWRLGGLTLLIVALAVGSLYIVLAVRARRAFTRAALRLAAEEDRRDEE